MPSPEPEVPAVPPAPGARRAHAFLALVALAALIRLAMPVGIGLFVGALLAFVLEPVYGQLRRRNTAAGPAALVCALGATLALAAVVVGLGTLLVTRGVVLASSLGTLMAPGGELRSAAEEAAGRLTTLHVNVGELLERVQSEAISLGSRIAGIAADVAGVTFSGLLSLFFVTMSAYFVLRYWTELVEQLERGLPFERRHTHALLAQFRTVGRQVLLGTVATGLIQGLLAWAGYLVTGVPEAAFFGALTAIASLLPGVGTLLIWVPIAIVRIATGHVVAGVIELLYSTLVVGIVADYVIRPRLVGSEEGVPAIVTFVALFGGVEVFGVIGLIVGPVIATLSFAILKTYAREADARG